MVIQRYQTILDALSRRMDIKEFTEGERISITEDMISVADKIAQTDLKNKDFLNKMVTKLTLVLGLVNIVIARVISVVKEGGRGIPLDNANEDETLT